MTARGLRAASDSATPGDAQDVHRRSKQLQALAPRGVHPNLRVIDVSEPVDVDDAAVSLAQQQQVAGTEYSSAWPSATRGMPASFSLRDINAVVLAAGPDFRWSFVANIPSATVDLAATTRTVSSPGPAVLAAQLPGQANDPVLPASSNARLSRSAPWVALKVTSGAGSAQIKAQLIVRAVCVAPKGARTITPLFCA